MSVLSNQMVLDLQTWPNNRGFEHADSWWQFVRTQELNTQLDMLFGMALVDGSTRERLLRGDPDLFRQVGLPDDVQDWMVALPGESLEEFAESLSTVLFTGALHAYECDL